MKLLIEIPDNIYRNCCSIPLNSVERAVKNGKPLDAVLDEIRAEIEALAKEYDKFADYRRVRGLWIALDIIDKYRKE